MQKCYFQFSVAQKWDLWRNRMIQFHIYLHHWTLCPALWRSWWTLDIPPCCILHLPVTKQNLRKNCKRRVFTPGGSAAVLTPNSSTELISEVNVSQKQQLGNLLWTNKTFVSHLFFCCFFRLRVHPAHILQAVLERPFNFCNHLFSLRHTVRDRGESEAHHLTQWGRLLWGKDFEGLTMALLSSAKVALTNMAPRAKPRALSVSLTHSFQRGVQLCDKWTHQDTLSNKNASSLCLTLLNNIGITVIRPHSPESISHFLCFPAWTWLTPQLHMSGLASFSCGLLV